jgi:putative oxidoreductase
MNWFGNQKGEGIEYHLLAIAIAVSIMVKGAGALSIDRALYLRLTHDSARDLGRRE